MQVTTLYAIILSLGAYGCQPQVDNATDTLASPMDSALAPATPQFADTPLAKDNDTADSDKGSVTPDGEAIGAFIAASQHEIQHGRIAMQNGSTQIVRDLGRSISRDHDDFVTRARELGKRLGILTAAHANDTSFSGHHGVMSELRGKTGTDFDRVYLQHEVDYHRWLINAVNNTMLPKASNTEVRTFLQQAVPTFEAHMKAAQDLLAKA
jgi:putative membrane protein